MSSTVHLHPKMAQSNQISRDKNVQFVHMPQGPSPQKLKYYKKVQVIFTQ